MLSLFPSLLTYERLGPLIIRVILGLTFVYFGYRHIKGRGRENISVGGSKIYGTIETATAVLLIIGLYTQLAALVIAVILTARLIYKIRVKAFLSDGVNYYLLLLAMALSLLVMRSGFLSFDLPL
jgi:uncharacterized membrane protein YphA (DoxX/SURF4 family)